MKPALRKMHDRLDLVGESREPLKPTIVAIRYREGLLFEGRIWPDFESIHSEYPGKFDRYHIGVEVKVVDGRHGHDATPSWMEGRL